MKGIIWVFFPQIFFLMLSLGWLVSNCSWNYLSTLGKNAVLEDDFMFDSDWQIGILPPLLFTLMLDNTVYFILATTRSQKSQWMDRVMIFFFFFFFFFESINLVSWNWFDESWYFTVWNFMIFLSFRFCVKSILGIQDVQNMQILTHSEALNFYFYAILHFL